VTTKNQKLQKNSDCHRTGPSTNQLRELCRSLKPISHLMAFTGLEAQWLTKQWTMMARCSHLASQEPHHCHVMHTDDHSCSGIWGLRKNNFQEQDQHRPRTYAYNFIQYTTTVYAFWNVFLFSMVPLHSVNWIVERICYVMLCAAFSIHTCAWTAEAVVCIQYNRLTD